MEIDAVILALWLWLLPLTAKASVIRSLDEDLCISYYYGGLLKADCSNLNLIELPEGMNYDSQLVDLSNNNFTSFPQNLQNFPRLESLDLSSNKLYSALPSFMGRWADFRTLNLSNNNYITWINTGQRYNIRRLDLSKNKINAIDDTAFNDMPLLYYLDLSDNKLTDLPPDMFYGTSLDSLILTRNTFTAVPKFTQSTLTNLVLSNCQIQYLPVDSLIEMNSILQIDLSMNSIETIPDDFVSNTLQELNLSYNEISSINDYTFSSLPHLAVLDLRGNHFTAVWSTSHFSSNPFLREVYLKGNRWSCEGFSVDLLLTYEFLTKEPAKIYDISSLICYSPENVTHLSWQEAYIRTWHPHEASTTSFTYIAVMIGVIIGIVLTSFVCRGLMILNTPETSRPRPAPQTTILNGNVQPAAETTVMRIPLRDEDLPPSYDEALLMPRLNSSFHSLPDFVDIEEDNRRHRRSRSIGDLVEHRPRTRDRRSVRQTVEIHINTNSREMD